MQVVDIDRTTGALLVRYRTNVSGACGDNGYGKCIAVVVDGALDGELEIINGHYVFDEATGESEQRDHSLGDGFVGGRSEADTSELQSIMRMRYDVFSLEKKTI